MPRQAPASHVGRPLQHRAVRDRASEAGLRQHAETLHHGAPFRVVGGVEHGVRIAVAAEKVLKPRQVRRAGNAHQHRARAAVLDQTRRGAG